MASKECKHPTCSGNHCRRIKKDKKIYTLKRSPIRKISKKRQKHLGECKSIQERDWLLYLKLWDEREHLDFETGEIIHGEPLTLYFHHCLPKAKYPQFRYVEENIILITWETHSKAETNIDFVPKIKAYTDFLKQKYSID